MTILVPLTFQQQWFWNLFQQHSNWNYLIPTVLRISGSLNTAALEASFQELVSRHDSLRTTFVVVDGMPMQEVRGVSEFELEIAPLVGEWGAGYVDPTAREIERFFDRAIDLAEGPLLKVRLLNVDAREHLLVVAIHHAIADGFSVSVMFRELWLLYAERLGVAQGVLLHKPAQHSLYAVRQYDTNRAWEEKHRTYWKERLAGATAVRWPLYESTQKPISDMHEDLEVSFSVAPTDEVRAFARRMRTFLPVVVLTMYVAALAKWCKQKDFVIPFVVAGRQDPELREMVGNLFHALYLRIECLGSEAAGTLLNRVTREFCSALSHQDSGRAMLQRPDLLAGTCVNWLPESPMVRARAPLATRSGDIGIDVEPFSFKWKSKGGPKIVDASLILFETTDEICGRFTYRQDLFPNDSATRFINDLRSASRQLLQDSSLPMLTTADLSQS